MREILIQRNRLYKTKLKFDFSRIWSAQKIKFLFLKNCIKLCSLCKKERSKVKQHFALLHVHFLIAYITYFGTIKTGIIPVQDNENFTSICCHWRERP